MNIKQKIHTFLGVKKRNVVIREISKKKYKVTYGPRYVTLDITNKCNLNCIGCWTYSPLIKINKPNKEWFKQELRYDKISELIKDLKDMGTEEIRLTGGGEPFFHQDIIKIITLIKNNGFRLDLTTNFSLVNKTKIDQILDLNINNITLSLWAATPEIYTKTHPNQTKKAFENIKKNLLYLTNKKKNTKVVIANVISNINYFEIEKMVNFAKEMNVDEVYFTLIDPIKNETEKLLLNKIQQKKLNKSFKKIIKNYENKKYFPLKIDNPKNFLRRIENKDSKKGNYDSNIIFDIPCSIGWTFSRIMANGDIVPCCRAVKVPTGNLNKTSFKKIWNQKKQQSFRKIGLELKKHPGFVKIVGCLKTCDNIMDNLENQQKIRQMKK